jgi:hypothetical protein
MSEKKVKPTRWFYVIAFFLPIFACTITAVPVYRNIPKLPGAFDDLNINNLTQVIVPGSTEVYFPEAGAYAVYYEYRSEIDGVSYVRSQFPPMMNCQLVSKKTGEYIQLASPNVMGEIYSTGSKGRAGVLMKSISINQPGYHDFSCRYLDNSSRLQSVLAVGPNFIWEFINLAAKPVGAMVCGMFVFLGVGVISAIMVIIVALKRHQSNRRMVNLMES